MPHDHHGHSHAHAQKTTTVAPNATIATANPNVTVTERAVKELQNVMAAEGAAGQALRLAVEPGGCAGYQYALSFAASAEGDEVAATSNGIRILVSKASIPMLNGLTIDFVDTPMGSGFHIKNPNAKSTCGCGNTFDA